MVATDDHQHALAGLQRDRVTRTARVRRLAREIASGRYRVDERQLAEVLIQRARLHRRVQLALLGRSPAR